MSTESPETIPAQFSCLITKMSDQSLFESTPDDFLVDQLSLYLDKRKILGDFTNRIEPGPVFVPEWVMLNQISKRKYRQFFLKKCSALRTDTF